MSDTKHEHDDDSSREYCTISGYAHRLSTSESTIRRLIKKGVFITVKPTNRQLLHVPTNDARFKRYCELMEERRKKNGDEAA